MTGTAQISKARLFGQAILAVVAFFIFILIVALVFSIGAGMLFPDYVAGIDPVTGKGGEMISFLSYPFAIIMSLLLVRRFLKKRGHDWHNIGLSMPKSWLKAAGLGLGIAIIGMLAAAGIGEVLAWYGYEQDLTLFEFLEGNLVAYIYMATIISWFAAGLGEEVVFRGYVMGNFVEALGSTRNAWLLAAFLQAIIFGAFHLYQGITGGVLTATIALVFGLAYYWTRSLWPLIIAHGLIDTYGMTVFYFGISELM